MVSKTLDINDRLDTGRYDFKLLESKAELLSRGLIMEVLKESGKIPRISERFINVVTNGKRDGHTD